MEKSIPELRADFVCVLCVCVCVYVCVRNNSFKIHVTILKYIRNVNLPFKKDFKFAEVLSKTSFFFYFRDRPKMVNETN